MTGAQKLRAWLDAKGTKQKWFAEQIGVPDSTVSNWVKGRHAPVLDHALRVQDATGGAVLVTDWGSQKTK